MPVRQNYAVALGANLPSQVGAPLETLTHALQYTEQYSCKLVEVSNFFLSPAFPAGSGPDYVNGAALIEGPGDPEEMLALLHGVEKKFGRERLERWGARTLDLDLLTAGDSVLPDAETYLAWQKRPAAEAGRVAPEELILPHPRMQERAFVLVPLAEVAPAWRHPVLGRTVLEMRDALPNAELAGLRRLAP